MNALNTERTISFARESNMELARIVAMTMVLVGHFIFHGIQMSISPSPVTMPRLGFEECVILVLSVLCTAGVDLFMLISGYFGIRLRWKSIISFWLLCIFYNAANLFVNTPVAEIGTSGILNSFFISKTPNWFFQGYFWVMMVSPILNKAIKEFDIKALRCIVAAGLVLICVSSWRFANPKGNTALLLMFVYFLGGYLRREEWFSKLTRGQSLAGFFGVAALGFVVAVVTYNFFHKEYGIYFQHNSFLVIAMAVALFMFFRKSEIHSGFVNTWASTVVSALFIQDVIFSRPLYGYIREMYLAEGLSAHLWLTIFGLTAAVLATAFIIEWPRKKVAGSIADWLSGKLNSIVNLGRLLGNE